MLYDAHCHPTDEPETLPLIRDLDTTLCIMATRFDDLDLVRETAREYSNVVPAFGLHPWYTHLVSFGLGKKEHYELVFGSPVSSEYLQHLPDPVPFEQHLERIEQALVEFPQSMVGEIGLDKAFKVKINGQMSPFKTSMDHQRQVFRKQLELAHKYGRAASCHGVQCHLPLLEECTAVESLPTSSLTQMRICLHSFSGTPDFASQRWTKLKVPVFFSVAVLINAKNKQKATDLIKAVPVNRILSESDYHAAGPYMMELLESSVELIEQAGVPRDQIEENFWSFVKG